MRFPRRKVDALGRPPLRLVALGLQPNHLQMYAGKPSACSVSDDGRWPVCGMFPMRTLPTRRTTQQLIACAPASQPPTTKHTAKPPTSVCPGIGRWYLTLWLDR